MIQSAHVIGMGRLGQHLADRLEALGMTVQRWNRSAHPGAKPLAAWTPDDADAVFLAVADDALPELATRMGNLLPASTWLIHHAGSVPRDVLGDRNRNAVLWPPMTFQSEVPPSWDVLPMAVDAVDPGFRQWARALAPQSFDVSDLQRRHLHLGAVLLGNLTAAWIGTVEVHLRDMGLDPSLLSPLVKASVDRALHGQALDTVTGPAARNDRNTLLAQQNLLHKANPDLADLHAQLTHRILSHHGHDPLPPFQAAPRRG